MQRKFESLNEQSWRRFYRIGGRDRHERYRFIKNNICGQIFKKKKKHIEQTRCSRGWSILSVAAHSFFELLIYFLILKPMMDYLPCQGISSQEICF